MDLLPTMLQVYRSSDPRAALHAMAETLSAALPLRCAVWVGVDRASIVCTYPGDVQIPPELLSIAGQVSRPEVFPVGALSPVAAGRYPDADMLLLPLPEADGSGGAVVLIAQEGAFGEDLEGWKELGVALASVAARERMLREAQEECEAHRKRAQEMEALDVLGLAANRTLDPDEVLDLVARFTRTLLGAHYAVVNTASDGEIHAAASVGLRACGPPAGGDPLARRVIEAGKPVVLGEGGEPLGAAAFPLHAAQGMQVGLGVPLTLFGETFGALIVGYRDPYPLTTRDTLLALTLARHAAVAINNAQLHAALAERSRELEHAYEELHRLSLLKERFFASMSHELRTPLNGVLGYQTLLLDDAAGEIPPEARRFLEKSNRAAQSLLALVNDILDYAKIEAGKMRFLVRPVAVREILDDALVQVEPLAAQKGLRLAVAAPEPDATLHTDPDRVCQILVNLLSNAIKFTAEGEISLAAAPCDGGDDGWLEVRVRDTGPGIARHDQEGIFEEFQQVNGTRGGTGLGLPISRRLARLLGGDLWVESTVGAGSTFTLRLPGEVPAEVAVAVPSGAG
ncbi:MAG TPA: GAF domain-containing sensor histidine kinase [Longimicrobiaceae bacterium]|nr:GAF domain-containing sensor histidine kinase [Longimicrobiaceae bacterium]